MGYCIYCGATIEGEDDCFHKCKHDHSKCKEQNAASIPLLPPLRTDEETEGEPEEQFEEKFIRFQEIAIGGEEGEAIPLSSVDFELFRKFTGLSSFNMEMYDEVSNMVAEHGYTIEVILSPDDSFGVES